jgi:hypothetical protein
MVFLFFFSSPNFIVFDISVFFYERLHHASTITSYISIIVSFVTFNIIRSHIIISCLKIYSTHSAIHRFMSKVIAS